MIDATTIADLARQLSEHLPPGLKALQAEAEQNFRALLTAQLGKLNLVTREEFDAQVNVLARTRQKLDALEAELAALRAGKPAP